MIDTLFKFLPAAGFDRVTARWPLTDRGYAVLTLHRPSNVDDPGTLRSILEGVHAIAREMPVVFPVHPRTRERLSTFGMKEWLGRLTLTEPLGYIDFLALTSHARLILTDSGGLQEESTALGIACLTVRENTERPVTITHGSNSIVGTKTSEIVRGYREALAREGAYLIPPLWDGRAAERVASVIRDHFC
jgi:UDP-N-acetylglucosamine 2-epimerase (non-hydrolysing)